MDQNESWHLDKKVPIAIIGTVLFQLAIMIWWTSALSQRVSVLEISRTEFRALQIPDRVARLEEQKEETVRRLNSIDLKLDRLIDTVVIPRQRGPQP